MREMPDHVPSRNFGVVDRKLLAAEDGQTFLRKLLEGVHPAPPFSEACDTWLIEVAAGKVVFEAHPSSRFYNPLGTVHGGWISAVLDSAMACAVHSLLKPGQGYTTVEMKINFVRPLIESSGKVRCEGEIVYLGSRMATSEGRLTDESGKLIAHGSETCMIFSA
jgi:uncharacterized protein (TIGR00369 family)